MENGKASLEIDKIIQQLASISSKLRHTKPIIDGKRIIVDLGSETVKLAESLAKLGQEMQK